MQPKFINAQEKQKEDKLFANFIALIPCQSIEQPGLNAVRKICQVIVDPYKYPVADLTRDNAQAGIARTLLPSLNMSLTCHYLSNSRVALKPKGLISPAEYLQLYQSHILATPNKTFHSEGNCAEICFLAEALLTHLSLAYELEDFRWNITYDGSTHVILRFRSENIPYYINPTAQGNILIRQEHLPQLHDSQINITDPLELKYFMEYWANRILNSQKHKTEALERMIELYEKYYPEKFVKRFIDHLIDSR